VADDEFDVLGLTHHDLDLTDRDATTRAVALTRPT